MGFLNLSWCRKSHLSDPSLSEIEAMVSVQWHHVVAISMNRASARMEYIIK